MTPRLIAFHDGKDYARMARVLEHTAAQHCAHWDRRIVDTALFTERQSTVEQRVRLDNRKLLRWTEAVEAAPTGTPMLLVDCDVMILRPLDDIWERTFDVAYTSRDPHHSPIPLNAGVVFVRATDAAICFLRAWYANTKPFKKQMQDKQSAGWLHVRRKYGACDQAGLCQTLKRPPAGATVLALPCQEWNCEDSEWRYFDAKTRLVHIKGALRQAVLGQPLSNPKLAPIVAPLAQRWFSYEQEAA